MHGRITSVAAILAATMAGACAPPAVTPLNEAARKTVTAVSPEVNGIKHFNTQNLGARGSSEGASKGASQAAGAVLQGGGNLLGVLILTPIAAAGGAAAGAAAAKPEAEVDQIRSNLSVAIQQTDFNTMLREELRRTPGTNGRVQIVDAALTAAPVPTKPPAAAPAAAMAAGGQPPPYMLSLDYNLGMAVTGAVVPDVQASVLIKGQILAPDRKTILHTNTWLYCGPKRTFDHAAANDGAALRADYRRAAQVVAEAITYDTFVGTETRVLVPPRGCMSFDNLPSGIAQRPPEVPVFVAEPTKAVSDPPSGTPR